MLAYDVDFWFLWYGGEGASVAAVMRATCGAALAIATPWRSLDCVVKAIVTTVVEYASVRVERPLRSLHSLRLVTGFRHSMSSYVRSIVNAREPRHINLACTCEPCRK